MSAADEPKKALKVSTGTHVLVELVTQADVERLEFDIVPDQHADFAHGFLGESTPLAQALLGKVAGQVVRYTVGDAQKLKVLQVSPGKLLDGEDISARRQEAMRKTLDQVERTNAITFASSYSGKWGDYDPSGIEGWDEKSLPGDPDKDDRDVT